MQGAQTTLPNGNVVKERYLVEDLLGKGGFGAVYLVRDQRVRGNLFALKEVIDPNTEDKQRFAFEGDVLKRLDHPGLPRVYRIFEDNTNYGDRLYILMDYIEGPNLEQLRQRQPFKRFSLQQAMDIMSPIVNAVSYLHRQQPPIIHRDIKPANIIVPNDYKQSVLVDFGIAKEYDQEGTTTAIRRCSPGYGAPEQYARGTNVQTDVYGLAATFYALLTGTIPADALYRMTQIGSRRADPLEPVNALAPYVPQHIADAIHRAMSINIHERFASVDAFWQALHTTSRTNAAQTPLHNDIESQPTIVAPITTATPHQPREGRRRRPVALLLLLTLALLALIGALLFAKSILPGLHTGPVTATPAVKQTGIAATPGNTPSSQPTAKPTNTPVPTTTPTTAPTSAPPSPILLHSTYGGTITDAIGPTTATMQLQRIVQNGTGIQGYFLVNKPLQGSNPFSGTVSSHTVQFTVQSFAGLLPLAFTGTVQANGSISGTYCAVNASGCDNSQGHGMWQVTPLA